ncbi:hypothetical protein N665_0462s0044 [Sinapis alba]|nr:hypothetical protein N665_0462s0044 [Sinapis alba]
MIKILSPHNSHSTTTTLKTAEILSKYRPIAPKPGTSQVNDNDSSSSMSHKISQSPYLRNLWPQLQARPTRTRKRGRGGMGPTSPLSLKRHKQSSPPSTTISSSTATTQRVFGPIKTLSFQAFSHAGLPNLSQVGYALENGGGSPPALVTLPLLQCSPSPPSKCMEPEIKEVIDLNKTVEVIQERDFLKQLQGPITTTATTSRVIAPQAIRPVCSRINVACINPLTNPSPSSQIIKKSPQDVEEEFESDDVPAIISDSNNRVRLVNSAYKEMMGQPECSWLDSMKSPQDVEEEFESDDVPAIISDSNNRVRLVNSAYKEMMGQPECSWLDSMVRGKRICGEVMIHLCEAKIPENNGFSCWVRIEWGRDGKEEFVHAFCDVMKLECDSKDYLFTWRFHTTTRETCRSRCHA